MKRIGIYFFCVIAVSFLTSSILYWENENSGKISVEENIKNEVSQNKTDRITRSLSSEYRSDNDKESQSEKQEELYREAASDTIPAYCMVEEDGYLVIYDRKKEKKYDETTILLKNLPKHLQELINNGLYFESEESLYEFLENYSS